jgi:hypothetical protein
MVDSPALSRPDDKNKVRVISMNSDNPIGLKNKVIFDWLVEKCQSYTEY